MPTIRNTNYRELIGKGKLGFPGSVITAVTPGLDYLMNGPMGSAEHGEAFGTITVDLADGRTVNIPCDIFRVSTYDRKAN